MELEGLVTIIPNKGAYVSGITPKDVHDIYCMRSYLEGLCARWATKYITPEQISKLEEIILSVGISYQAGKYGECTAGYKSGRTVSCGHV